MIYRIQSGQGFIGSLILVICKRIIGSMIRRVPLGEGSEINHCAQRFWPWIRYVLHIWDPLPRSVDSLCVVVSSGLLKLKFKPVSAYYWVKVIRKSIKCQWNTNIWMSCAKLCFGFTTKSSYITQPNTCACSLQGGTASFVTLLEMLLLVILNLLVCFSDLFAAILPYT